MNDAKSRVLDMMRHGSDMLDPIQNLEESIVEKTGRKSAEEAIDQKAHRCPRGGG